MCKQCETREDTFVFHLVYFVERASAHMEYSISTYLADTMRCKPRNDCAIKNKYVLPSNCPTTLKKRNLAGCTKNYKWKKHDCHLFQPVEKCAPHSMR